MSKLPLEKIFLPAVTTSVVVATILVTLYIQGYRLNLNRQDPNSKLLKTTGILAVTSLPKSAAVYLDNKLVASTDNSLTLDPKNYQLKIVKDGYLPWQKNYQIKPEVVFTTSANLFKSVPNLEPITISGAINPKLSSDGKIIVFAVNSAAASKDNGLYLYETNSNLNLIKANPRQIAPNFPPLDWAKAVFEISPNNRHALAYFGTATYSFDLSDNLTSKSLTLLDSKEILALKKAWQDQNDSLLANELNKLPSNLQPFVTSSSANSLIFNSSKDKLIYQASQDTILGFQVKPTMPARSTQTETRQIKTGQLYVYDLIDDTNYFLADGKNILRPQWIPDTDNLIFIKDNQIYVQDYDSTNSQVIFAGNFDQHILSSTSDGKKLILLTSPYPGASQNLYTVTVR